MNLFRDSPGCLAKIGTLAGDLEVKVLFTIVLLRERSVCERIGSVVMIDQVRDDLSYVSDVAPVWGYLINTAPDSQRVMPVLGSSIAGTLQHGKFSQRGKLERRKQCSNHYVNEIFSPAIGIFIGEWFGLDIFLHIKELGLVWHFELF